MNIALVSVLEFEPIRKFLRGLSNSKSTGYPPIGLMTLAAVLEDQGHEIKVIDPGNLILNNQIAYDDNFSVEAARYLSEIGADVMGFSSRCDNYLHSLRIAEEFSKRNPGIPVVFGGPQSTITDTASMEKFPFIDFVVRHEAEKTFAALLQSLEHELPVDEIPGIVYRCGDRIVKSPDPPLILNLDEIPIPSFKHYPIETLESMPIEVGRGCPFGCTFCVTNRYFNRRYRLKSADRIIDEVELLQRTYGFKKFNFIHDMMTANRQTVSQLCKRILERGIKFEWTCSARTDCLDRELLEMISAAGGREIYCGIETGSQRMQKVVNKNLKLQTVFPVMEICDELGISVTTSFITGFPEEEEEDIEATLQMMSELSSSASGVQLHLYSPTPGTPLNDKFIDRLIFTGYISDFGFATSFSDEDARLIKQNPDIFTNYFQVKPVHLDFEAIKGLDAFGYCIQHFPHFFFYLAHEPDAPSLFEFWKGLKKWSDNNGVVWDIETHLTTGLNDVLEHYIGRTLIDYPDLPPILTDAFNLDRALLVLEKKVSEMPDSSRSRLQEFNTQKVMEVRARNAKIRLRSPMVLTEARFNLSEIMESVRRRKYAPLEADIIPAKIGIFIVKERIRSRGFTFGFVKVDDFIEATLEAADSGCSFEEFSGLVSATITNGTPAQLKQKCLSQADRLMRLQVVAADADERVEDCAGDGPCLMRLVPICESSIHAEVGSESPYNAEARV